ncbi:unnamed protein product, partial [Onchocerca ochengi]|uniref:DOMON domain-containing protein n=1 Tax=Onchocerca ochengi TaxID=42157 RepID=A0A182EXF9_ONCOC
IELDGRTIVMFRRMIAEIEPSDHPLGPGKIFVIYAKGQKMGSYSHSVKSALEQGPINDHNFYTQDEVKYHGSKNRGVHPIEFVSIAEKPPSIRPPPRFRQEGPPQHPSNMNDSSNHQAEVSKISLPNSPSTITRSETTSSVTNATVRPSVSKPTLKPKTETTTKKQNLITSTSITDQYR